MSLRCMVTLLLVFCAPIEAMGSDVLSPASPRIHDTITLTFVPGDGPLHGSASVQAEVMVVRGETPPLLVEVPLKQEGESWKGTLMLSETKSLFLITRFVDGEMKDDNAGKFWTAVVSGSHGKAVKGGYASKATWLMGGVPGDLRTSPDIEAAKEALAEELKVYPTNWKACIYQWSLLKRSADTDETTALIKNSLESVYDTEKGNPEAVEAMIPWFEQTGQQERAAKIRSAAIAAEPKSRLVWMPKVQEAMREKDPLRRATLLENILAEYPVTPPELKENLGRTTLSSYASAQKWDEVVTRLDKSPHPDPAICNQVAWTLAEKGERLETAARLAQLAVNSYRAEGAAKRPSYVSLRQWKENNKQILGSTLDTYGFALEKLHRSADAKKAYAEAYTLTDGTDPEMNERYMHALVGAGDYGLAETVGQKAVTTGRSNDSVMTSYRLAYTKVHGSEEGFDAAIARARSDAMAAQQSELQKTMLNMPAPLFALKSVDGGTVNLADLKGKVVIIDFWATWCGPCKSSFPFLQKFYDKYRKDPRLVLYTLNSWERVKGAEREATVKKFLADNHYTFPVLYDEDIIEKYGVDGIPTKFMIDQRGQIRFKNVGFEGGDKMLQEMEAEIAVLLGKQGG
jgi:thiol-disulfide isomerase/thioredoxin